MRRSAVLQVNRLLGAHMARLSLLFLLTMMTGCSLSEEKHLDLNNIDGQKRDSGCGYFDNALTLGDENQSTILIDNAKVELCSINYQMKVIAKGFIIPFYPVSDGNELSYDIRWVRVKNLSQQKVSILESSEPLIVTSQRYPIGSTTHLNELEEGAKTLGHDQLLWVGFPLEAKPELKVAIQGKATTLKFSEGRSFSWFMVTH